MGIESILMWIILLPIAGAVINGFFGKNASREAVGVVAIGSVALSFVFALVAFATVMSRDPSGGAALTLDLYEWFSMGLPAAGNAVIDVPVNVRFKMDALSAVMTLVVTGIGLLIHIYSLGYMSEEKSYARFFSYLNLFTGSMLILVLASNLVVMFVGWEGVGLCSYLLIGFWYENGEYAQAGKKAFVVNRIGDFGVIIGGLLLVSFVHSFEFDAINAGSLGLIRPFFLGTWDTGTTVATAACFFLFLGCTGKSAQIPLFVWLPDAMAGPTPVSALIHAATMVTAGVYLCCRLSGVFMLSPAAMGTIAIIGTLTALVAASVALVQKDMKKILAYSTVSQLGFMFAAVGVGAFAAGFFHVFTHAFFKACLFLGAGSVMHAVGAHGDANIFKLGGLQKIMPKTRLTFWVSCAAIAGFPLTAGFFSKDEILLGASTLAFAGEDSAMAPWVGWFVLVGLFVAATMTAFYMWRLYYLTFTGDYRSAAVATEDDEGDEAEAHGDDHGYDAHPHESPSTMTTPLLVLAGGAAVVGFLGMPHELFEAVHLPNWWLGWMHNSMSHAPGLGPHDAVAIPAQGIAMALGISAWAIGWLGARAMYMDKSADPFAEKLPSGLYHLLFQKWRVDELYDATIVRFVKAMATFSGWLDKVFVDFLLTRLTSVVVAAASWVGTRVQDGYVWTYGAMMAVGLAAATWYVLVPHPNFEAEIQGADVSFVAQPGMGYQYRWDFEGDHVFDAPEHETARERHFSDTREVSHTYLASHIQEPVLLLAVADGADNELLVGHSGQEVDTFMLTPVWATDLEEPGRPPGVHLDDDGHIVIRPNGATFTVGGVSPEGDEHVLRIGERAMLGGVAVTAAGRVRATLQVRSAFGHVSGETLEFTIRPAPEPEPTEPQAALVPAEVAR